MTRRGSRQDRGRQVRSLPASPGRTSTFPRAYACHSRASRGAAAGPRSDLSSPIPASCPGSRGSPRRPLPGRGLPRSPAGLPGQPPSRLRLRPAQLRPASVRDLCRRRRRRASQTEASAAPAPAPRPRPPLRLLGRLGAGGGDAGPAARPPPELASAAGAGARTDTRARGGAAAAPRPMGSPRACTCQPSGLRGPQAQGMGGLPQGGTRDEPAACPRRGCACPLGARVATQAAETIPLPSRLHSPYGIRGRQPKSPPWRRPGPSGRPRRAGWGERRGAVPRGKRVVVRAAAEDWVPGEGRPLQ